MLFCSFSIYHTVLPTTIKMSTCISKCSCVFCFPNQSHLLQVHFSEYLHRCQLVFHSGNPLKHSPKLLNFSVTQKYLYTLLLKMSEFVTGSTCKTVTEEIYVYSEVR